MANIPVYSEGIDMNLHMSELNTSLQQNFSDNGVVIPSQEEATISSLSTATTAQKGMMWYDTDNDRWIGLKNGVLVEFGTTPI